MLPQNLPKIFDSRTLMQDVKSLLAPGGRVLVREVTPRKLKSDFINWAVNSNTRKAVPITDYFMV